MLDNFSLMQVSRQVVLINTRRYSRGLKIIAQHPSLYALLCNQRQNLGQKNHWMPTCSKSVRYRMEITPPHDLFILNYAINDLWRLATAKAKVQLLTPLQMTHIPSYFTNEFPTIFNFFCRWIWDKTINVET